MLGSAKTSIDWSAFAGVVAGSALVMASGCVFNNYIDRGIDKKMSRTKKRAIAAGDITAKQAIVFGTVLGLLGTVILIKFTNPLTTVAGLAGFFFYVVVYGFFKRRSKYGTLIGTISGAVPPLAGYTAATNSLDGGALLLFLILVAWQMPHFYAIAMRRFEDYKAARLPVWPVENGMKSTKIQILFFIVCFIVLCILLSLIGYTGIVFALVMAGAGIYWLGMGIRGFKVENDKLWAKKMFVFSLLVLLTLSVMLSVGGRLV